MHRFTEVCDLVGITVVGIIDSDYYGNTEQLCGIPVIDTEASFEDPEKLDHYKKNYNFFCATNWTPEKTPVSIRNREKRHRLLEMIDQFALPCISLVDPDARISKYSTVGCGVFVDACVMLEPNVSLGNYTNIYYGSIVGHDSIVGRNCVIQRKCMLAAHVHVDPDVYFGLEVKALKDGARFGQGTFIHEAIYIRRGTVPGEVVSVNGSNNKRIICSETS